MGERGENSMSHKNARESGREAHGEAPQMQQAAEQRKPAQSATHLGSQNNSHNIKKEALGQNTRR